MLKTILTIGLLQILTIAVQVVRAKTISVGLGPAGLGAVGLIDQLLTAIVQVCSFSLPAVALRVLPRVHDDDPAAFRRQYAALLRTVVGATLLGSAAAALALSARPALLGDALAPFKTEALIALLGGPAVALGILLPNVLAASMRGSGAAWLSFAFAAATALAAWAGILLGGIREIYLVQVSLGAVAAGATLVYFARSLDLPIFDRSASVAGEIRRRPDLVPSAVAIYFAIAGAAVSLLAVRSATARSLGLETAGWLQALLSVVLGVGTVLTVMGSRYLGPVLNRPSSATSKLEIAEMFRKRQLFLFTAMALPLAIFAEVVLVVVFSRQFAGAAPWLPLLLLWQLLAAQAHVQQQLLFALDEFRLLALATFAGYTTAAALAFVLVPALGLTGIAAGLVAGEAVQILTAAAPLSRRHGHRIPARTLGLTAYVAAALLMLPYLLGALGTGWSAVGARLTAGLAAIAGLWMFLGAAEREALRAMVRRAPAPVGQR